MKKVLKITGIVLLIAVLAVAGLLSFVAFVLPKGIPVENITVEPTPERVERGRYLANNRMGCVGCHAERDFSRYAGPIIEETKGAGGEFWNREMNFPGEMYAPNITPYALKGWSDGELFRAITAGIDKDGNALFPIMPYHLYGRLPKEDIYDVIAYIRTLEPQEKTWPDRKLDFPMSLIVNLIPAEGLHDLAPDKNDVIKHGEYVIASLACYDCHTPMEDGQYINEMAYAGGNGFPLPTGGIVYASNLTPDENTGIGRWTEEMFVRKFKAFADSSYTPHKIAEGEFNSFMPWDYYAQLEEEDLKAVYAYLMNQKPIQNQVVKFVN